MRKTFIFTLGVVVVIILSACSQSMNEQFNDAFFDKESGKDPQIRATIDREYDFAVLGDNRPDSKSLEYFLRMIDRLNINHVYHLGDLVEFSSPLFFVSILEAIESSYPDGEFNAVVGNHDVDGHGGNNIKNLDIFNHFMDIEERKSYRHLERNGRHFILLNSYLPNLENRIGNEQLAWLEDALGKIAMDDPLDIFVFMHHPMYPAGFHDPLENTEEVHDILKKYPITAVFAGHEHLYYHEFHDSIHYFVSGGAGSKLHKSAPLGNPINHFLAVSVSPNFHVDVFNISGEIVDSEGEDEL